MFINRFQNSGPSRREFLAGTTAWLGATAATQGTLSSARIAAASELGRARTISIFHTTDLHGRIVPTSNYDGLDDVGGFARCATCIRQWRKESPHSLTVDVGDVVQGTAVSMESGGNLLIDLFNRLGYDAWTLGNHDFDWGPQKLEANLERSKSPVLTANLARSEAVPGEFTGAWKKVEPWIMREVGGFRIALIGLITPGLPYWLASETRGGAEVTDPIASLTKSVAAALAAKADAIVVMGHMGWRFQDDYANPVRSILRACKGIDCYLAGHSHQNQPSWMLHDVLCSQASYYGIHCGRIDLTFDLETRKLLDKRAFTLLMDDRFELDPAVMQLAQPDLATSQAAMAREVATVTETISGKGRKSGLVRLLCETFSEALARNKTPVDGIFHGSFGSGDLAPGKLTVGDCWRIIPYENMLATAEVSARELMAILAEDSSDKKSDRALWPFEVMSEAGGKPIGLNFGGQAVAADRRFTIGLNSYDAQSGGRRMMELRSILADPQAKRITTSLDTRGALIEGLLNRGQI
ncbi:MAG: bifunctional UDP-sugar hydrolase/5'-nucleotidase [Planctomycetia bacterium]|nr:bifunctional UDP-sugar hydrolase/5'-nucleotidase [Planctomycetia bacterium]